MLILSRSSDTKTRHSHSDSKRCNEAKTSHLIAIHKTFIYSLLSCIIYYIFIHFFHLSSRVFICEHFDIKFIVITQQITEKRWNDCKHFYALLSRTQTVPYVYSRQCVEKNINYYKYAIVFASILQMRNICEDFDTKFIAINRQIIEKMWNGGYKTSHHWAAREQCGGRARMFMLGNVWIGHIAEVLMSSQQFLMWCFEIFFA